MKRFITVLAFVLLATIAAEAAPKHLLSRGVKSAAKHAAKGVKAVGRGAFKAGRVVF